MIWRRDRRKTRPEPATANEGKILNACIGNANSNRLAGRSPVILIHPPIYDFTAFDFYVYPLGLLNAGHALMSRGFDVKLVDALDRNRAGSAGQGLKRASFRPDGCGHFPRVVIPQPRHLSGVRRRFHRFGLPESALRNRLRSTGRPAAVAVTCSMTYWYQGVVEVVRMVRDLWDDVPVVLGGVYASLCPEHARSSTGADFVLQGRSLDPVIRFVEDRAGEHAAVPKKTSTGQHHIAGERPSAAVQASHGCPRKCPYCAAHLLGGAFKRRPLEKVLDEITFLVQEKQYKHIAFYDDALLEGDETCFLELTAGLVERRLHCHASFHCPNALHATAVTYPVAKALKAANFRTIRIGFETADPTLQNKLGGKTTNRELEAALGNLEDAGFNPREIGVYILAGLPGQDPENVEESIRFVHAAGAQSRLAEYSPVPGTPLFEKAKRLSNLDLDEPVNHNKTLAPFRFSSMGPSEMNKLKDTCRKLNSNLLGRIRP